MLRLLKAIGRGFVNLVEILFTGGRFGGPVRTDRSREYAKRQEQRQKDFFEHGGHPCKICGTRIPGNKLYCAACYHQYVKT
jgi:hypothetical protein